MLTVNSHATHLMIVKRGLADRCREQGWVLKNSPTGRSFDLGDFPVGDRAFFFYLRSEP